MDKLLDTTAPAEFITAMHHINTIAGQMLAAGVPRVAINQMFDTLVEEVLRDYRALVVEEILASQRDANDALRGVLS